MRNYKKQKSFSTAVFRHLSLRCGCPVDTSAKQKHRPSRQARPPLGAWQSALTFSSLRSRVTAVAIRSLLKGITDSFTLRVQNDKPFSCHERRKVCAISYRSVIAVRVSGGHLCEAEAPTEPAGETAARRAAIRSLAPSSLRAPKMAGGYLSLRYI